MIRVLTLHLPMIAFLIFIGIPLIWALSLSFREGASVIRGEFQVIPRPATIANYIYVWTSNKLNKFFVNSMITSFGSVFIIGFLALFNGYDPAHF